MKLPALAAVAVLASAAPQAAAEEAGGYPRVYRTFMPDAGPSAFAVELSPDLALCYDPLRGGVNLAWTGRIDLSPTTRAKINEPARPEGQVFYAETVFQPLRPGDPAEAPERRFRGYRYEAGAVVFDYTLDGAPVSEELRASEDGRGLVRTFQLPEGQGAWHLLVESRQRGKVEVRGGAGLEPGLWRFDPGSRFSLIITPKHGEPDAPDAP